MAQFCVKNATEIPSTIKIINEKIFVEETRIDGIVQLIYLLKYIQGTSFNCFYTFSDPLRATGIRSDFNLRVLFWNILYNFGFFYSDFKVILQFWYFKKGTPASNLITWKRLAKAFGDLTTRIFFSRYYPKRLEDFFSYL